MPAMNATRLLLLEDDAASRAWLHAALLPLGLGIDIASTCAEAAHLAHAGHALWLFDANLPDGLGADLLLALRARGLDVPALALSAEAATLRTGLLAAGFVDALAKPLPGSELRMAVATALARARDDIDAVWDDARALQALGGNGDAVQSLRSLFLHELPGQLERVRAALARADADAARSELHKLKAGCGFVGARRLQQAVAELHAAPDHDAALARLLDVGAQQLAAR
jgi:DNA-binding response OmpR family regulator